jgi:hypothetical protein
VIVTEMLMMIGGGGGGRRRGRGAGGFRGKQQHVCSLLMEPEKSSLLAVPMQPIRFFIGHCHALEAPSTARNEMGKP